MATLGIRPTNDADLDKAHYTLTFFKTLTSKYIEGISEEFQIRALRIQPEPDPKQSWRLITNYQGEPLGYFVWPKSDRERPSTTRSSEASSPREPSLRHCRHRHLFLPPRLEEGEHARAQGNP